MAREQFRQNPKQTAATAPSMVNAVTGGDEVINPTTTEVISPVVLRFPNSDSDKVINPTATEVVSPAVSNSVSVQAAVTAPTVQAITGGDEFINPTATEVVSPAMSDSASVQATDSVQAAMISPTVDTITGGDEVANPNTTEVISPAANTSEDNSDDTENLYSDSSFSCASEEDFDAYNSMHEQEDDNLWFFKNICTDETDDGLETMVFSTTDLNALKEKEKNLKTKVNSKYFRSKINDQKLYNQITECVRPYLTDDKLRMLNHPWSTKLNEALNNQIASHAPKTKTFCRTMSLKTRVGIAAAVQALGYQEFWTRIFNELGLDMDASFAASLKARDTKKKGSAQKIKRKDHTTKRVPD